MKNSLLILLALTSSVCYSQKEIHLNELPMIIDGDTVYCKQEVWVESVDSEIHQRHKVNVLEKKLNKIRVALKHKEGYEFAIDSMIVQVGDLETERDSLLAIVELEISDVNSEVKKQLISTLSKLKNVKEQYFIIKKEKRKASRIAFISICTNLLFLTVIIVAI